MRANTIIVIPVYKDFESLTISEQQSFKTCLNLLKGYQICVVGPDSINYKDYIWTAETHEVVLNVQNFKSEFFKSIDTYNDLMMSKTFYKAFYNWEYLFVYQLDAWVFTDKLFLWSDKKYDYIGAPLFEGFGSNTNYKFIDGQNGGVSLRNIESAMRIIRRLQQLKLIHIAVRILSFNRVKSPEAILNRLKLHKKFKIKNPQYLRELFSRGINEDYRWSYYIAQTFSDFQVAPTKDAIAFCFEVHPKYLYKLNDEQLPFATHAWEKYDPVFWKQFIKTDKQGI